MKSQLNSSVSGRNIESILKVVTYSLILILNLRRDNLNAQKLRVFLTGCHFLRRIRQFVFKLEAQLQECPEELLKQILLNHGQYREDIDFGNLLVCSCDFVPKAINHSQWILVQSINLRWASIVALPIKGMENILFASQQLIHNLHNGGYTSKASKTVIFPETIQNTCSYHAKSSHIAILNTSCPDVNLHLKHFFSYPKYLQVNDVIKVDETLSFKVKSIEIVKGQYKNIGYFLEHNKSSLQASDSKLNPKFSTSVRLKKSWMEPCLFDSYEKIMNCTIVRKPTGLLDYCEDLEEAIKPYIGMSGPQYKLSYPLPSFLIIGASGSGKRTIVKSVSDTLGLQLIEVSCLSLLGESSKATELRIQSVFQNARQFSPSILYLTDIELIGKNREGAGPDYRVLRYFTSQLRDNVPKSPPVFIIGSCLDDRKCSADICSTLLHKICISPLTVQQRLSSYQWILNESNISTSGSLENVASKSHGFQFGDLNAVISISGRHAALKDGSTKTISQASLEYAIDTVRRWQSQSINAPHIPEVRWEDVGGLQHIITELLDTIQLPLKFPELIQSGLKRSGVLLYGPPGTGKTLLAKAVATECSLHFMSVKGPELLNMYVGQSEENVRNVFQAARLASPCLIFFDELDSLAPNRGRSGDSGGVMDRVVSQLLAELDGINKSAVVFVIGATNRPDLIDPALLRPGRFDKLLCLGTNDSKENQKAVLKALTRKFSLDPEVNLNEIVYHLPNHLTGADLYSLCANTLLKSVERNIKLIEKGHEINEVDQMLTYEDFYQAASDLVPSVSAKDLESYKQLENQIFKA